MRTNRDTFNQLGTQPNHPNAALRRHLSFAVTVLLVLAGNGCHKQAEPVVATEANSAAAPEEGKIPMRGNEPGSYTILPTNAVVIPENADVNATLEQLSVELRKYVVRTRTAPKSFEEFAAKSRVQAPPPPSGKKYAIERGTVTLVKN